MPELVHFGGIVDETKATLALYSDELDPAEVSQYLGVNPKWARKKGEKIGERSPPAKTGFWLFEIQVHEPKGPEEAICELLAHFPQDVKWWQALAKKYRVELRLGIFFTGFNRGFEISTETAYKIANTGAKTVYDLYPDSEDT